MSVKETAPEKVATAYISTLADSEVAALEQAYFLKSRYQVLGFIEQYPFLMSFLLEAPEKIKNFFSDAPLSLKVVSDVEEPLQVQLVLSIEISYDADQAFDQLNELEVAWWLDASERARHKISILTEYV